MSLRLVLRRAAQVELDEAAELDEGQRPGLGVVFVSEVQQVSETISVHPLQYPSANRDVRGALVPRFPYGVYFRVKPDQAVIIAVFHTSREPTIWRGRK